MQRDDVKIERRGEGIRPDRRRGSEREVTDWAAISAPAVLKDLTANRDSDEQCGEGRT